MKVLETASSGGTRNLLTDQIDVGEIKLLITSSHQESLTGDEKEINTFEKNYGKFQIYPLSMLYFLCFPNFKARFETFKMT